MGVGKKSRVGDSEGEERCLESLLERLERVACLETENSLQNVSSEQGFRKDGKKKRGRVRERPRIW
jgi:hypothetical protein